jgi:ribosomal protein S18 acetylase RimI-like enzyme
VWRSARESWLASTKLAQKQTRIFGPLQVDREAYMEGRAYTYLVLVGVASEFQGQGLGGKLLGTLIGESEQAGLPVYTETQTQDSVRFYEGVGFRVLDRVTLPVIGAPHWEMIREPEA